MPSTSHESSGFDLSPTDAAEIVGCHPRTIKRWVKAGKLRAFRTPGGWLRFRREDVEQFIRESAA